MSGRTPGPWKWNKDDDDCNIEGADGSSVLWGIWYNTSDAGARIGKDEDARLIAAAPDLAEAAREALGILHQFLGVAYRPDVELKWITCQTCHLVSPVNEDGTYSVVHDDECQVKAGIAVERKLRSALQKAGVV